ncbi:CRM-domain containing factor CFM2, chloroplastic isoform X1 [Tanacetum coccineum]
MPNNTITYAGRSNIVSGVAKTIKTHFQKHPLAIVNIKGRARGTSVQEMVSKLEEATGAILVSQEPSKVILYRGWGASTTHHSNQSSVKQNRSDYEGILKRESVVLFVSNSSPEKMEFAGKDGDVGCGIERKEMKEACRLR